jgi:phosphoribosylamine--glycine ligase
MVWLRGGVLIIHDFDRSQRGLRNMLLTKNLCREFKSRYQFLDGIELSCFVLTDGKTTKSFLQPKIISASVKAIRGSIQAEWELFPVPYVDVLMANTDRYPQLTISRKMGYRTRFCVY